MRLRLPLPYDGRDLSCLPVAEYAGQTGTKRGGSKVSALEGLRIVELGRGMAGAMAGMFLAEKGATVVKVEPPGGVPYRHEPSALVWDRGKESVVLDLKTDGGRSDLHDLLGWAD